jgi:hypothetical protein
MAQDGEDPALRLLHTHFRDRLGQSSQIQAVRAIKQRFASHTPFIRCAAAHFDSLS